MAERIEETGKEKKYKKNHGWRGREKIQRLLIKWWKGEKERRKITKHEEIKARNMNYEKLRL